MKKYNFFISLCLSLLFVCGALFSMFLRITLILLFFIIYDLFIIDQLPRDFEISYWKEGNLTDYRVTTAYSDHNVIDYCVHTYEKNNKKLYVDGTHCFWIIDYVHGNITLFDENLTKEDVDAINSYVDTNNDTALKIRNKNPAPRCLIWVGERNKCSLCSYSLLPMDKLWDLDVEIQLAASQIDHGLEIFIISEPSGATLDVLYNAVHPFQNGIRIGVLEIVQDLVPMIADRATKLLHGFQSCVHHPAAELFQTLLRLVSMDGLLVDFLQFDAHGTGTRCL